MGDIIVDEIVGAEKVGAATNCGEMIGDIVLVGMAVVAVGGVYTVEDVLLVVAVAVV